MQAVASNIDYTSEKNYDIAVPSTFSNSKSRSNIVDWLNKVLNDAPLEWESTSGDIRVYDLSVAKNLDILNVKDVIEVAYIDGTYNISYNTNDGEFVTLEYLSDGTKNKYVRKATEDTNQSDAKTPADVEVLFFDGYKQTVSEYETSVLSEMQPMATTQVSFPTPKQCGFTDTGSSGTVTTTQNVYIASLGKNQTARVVKYETNYQRVGSGWRTWGANTAISAIATYFGWGTVALANFLSGAGVVIALVGGIQQLNNQLSLPQYPDYTANDGKYGDIYDTTTYNKYCRVFYNVGTSQYISGISSSGSFTDVKKGYNGIKTDSVVISQVQSLFNSCIATYGYNALYSPV